MSDPPFKGLIMTSEHPPLWNGVYPSFFPTQVNLYALLLMTQVQLCYLYGSCFIPLLSFLPLPRCWTSLKEPVLVA